MTMSDVEAKFDLIVLGGGPGGYPLAARMARAGWKTALVERPLELGGTCLNWGCIPTKAYLASAKGLSFLRKAEDFGLTLANPGFQWDKVVSRKDRIVSGLRQGVHRVLTQAGVKLYEGTGTLQQDHRVLVQSSDGTGTTLCAEKICLATGSRPARPGWIPPNQDIFWTSDDALKATSLPETLLVVGGGVIGLELGQVFSDFGVRVTVVEYLPTILPGLDTAVVKRLLPVFRKSGMTIQTGTKVESLVEKDGKAEAVIAGAIQIFDRVLVAVGRSLNRTAFSHLAQPPEEKNGFLRISDHFETSIPGVFAIGDAIPGPMLAHKATYDAWVLGEQWLGKRVLSSYEVLPSCVYTHPEIAWVGLSEDQARERGLAVRVGRSMFSANGKAQTAGEPEGQVKTHFDDQGNLVGAVVWGPEASNLIMEPTLMMARQIPAQAFLSVIHPHPTLSEAYLEAVADGCGSAIHG